MNLPGNPTHPEFEGKAVLRPDLPYLDNELDTTRVVYLLNQLNEEKVYPQYIVFTPLGIDIDHPDIFMARV